LAIDLRRAFISDADPRQEGWPTVARQGHPDRFTLAAPAVRPDTVAVENRGHRPAKVCRCGLRGAAGRTVGEQEGGQAGVVDGTVLLRRRTDCPRMGRGVLEGIGRRADYDLCDPVQTDHRADADQRRRAWPKRAPGPCAPGGRKG